MNIYLANVETSTCVDGDYDIVIAASCPNTAKALLCEDWPEDAFLRRLSRIGVYTGHRADAYIICSDAVYR